jgi:uncharacterized membrane protein
MSRRSRLSQGKAHGPARRLSGEPGEPPGRAWIPAAVGLAVSAYLLGLDLTGATAFCVVPSTCDAVRGSAYGRVLGVPLSVLGVLFFAGALGLCLIRHPRRDRWLDVVAAGGAGAAFVFVALQIAVIRAVCPYCLVAEAAAVALAYFVFRRAPVTRRKRAGVAAVLTALILSVAYAVTPPPPANAAYAAGLARHLARSAAVFYGAYWCPHCREQKALFGPAAVLLPYVECDPRGTNAQPERCRARGIRVYPTWELHGQLVEGVLTLRELAQRSGYEPPPSDR